MKNKMMHEKITTKMAKILDIAKEMIKIKNVEAVYLFGSQATGKAGKISDIDICIIGRLSPKERLKILDYSSDNLDISFLEELPLLIKMRVFKDGKELVSKKNIDETKIKVLSEYLDFKRVINRYCEEMLKCTI